MSSNLSLILVNNQDRSLAQNRVSVMQRMFVGMREALRQRVSSSARLDYYARQAGEYFDQMRNKDKRFWQDPSAVLLLYGHF